MSKQFRRIEESFSEPTELSGADLLGRIQLKPGSLFFGVSNIAIAVNEHKEHTYKLDFTVAEDTRDLEMQQHDIVLVGDLQAFKYEGAAFLLGELRKQGNCGGYLFLVSNPESSIEQFPSLQTGVVSIYSEPSESYTERKYAA